MALVKVLDENGNKDILISEDDKTKYFCHEIDHLKEILFIDKVIEWYDV